MYLSDMFSELRTSLEEHQSALELIMSKYREQVFRLLMASKRDDPTIVSQLKEQHTNVSATLYSINMLYEHSWPLLSSLCASFPNEVWGRQLYGMFPYAVACIKHKTPPLYAVACIKHTTPPLSTVECIKHPTPPLSAVKLQFTLSGTLKSSGHYSQKSEAYCSRDKKCDGQGCIDLWRIHILSLLY